MHSLSYKEIADTFFGKSAKDRDKKEKPKKNRVLPIVITFVFLPFLVLISVFLGIYIKNKKAEIGSQNVNFSYSENILRGGRLNYSKIEKFGFEGDARAKSVLLNFSVKLVNFGNSGNASLKIIFKEPVDFSEKFLLLSAKTAGGKNKIRIILRDDKGGIYETSDICFFPNWVPKCVRMNRSNNFDLSRVGELKLSFGTKDTGNPQNSTIYMKDVILSCHAGA